MLCDELPELQNKIPTQKSNKEAVKDAPLQKKTTMTKNRAINQAQGFKKSTALGFP